MPAVDDMEDWTYPPQAFYGLNSTTMVERMVMCVGGMAINGSFVDAAKHD